MAFSTEKLGLDDPKRMSFKRILRKIFIEDWLMKLIALTITLGLWLGVSGLRAQITTRLNNIVLQPLISNEVEITNSPATEVALVVTGDRRKIDQIRADNLIATLDLTGIPPGDRIVQLTSETVKVPELPTGVKIEEIQPNRIAIKLETVEEREIPVKPEIEGSVGENFELYNIAVVPQSVRVRGPSSYIRSLDFVPTEKIDISNTQTDFIVEQVPLNLSNPKATILDAAIRVIFKIGEKRIERAFTITAEDGFFGKKVSFKLYGAHSLVTNLNGENLQARIVKNEAGEDVPQIILPPELDGKVEIRDAKIIN
jgi:hypothetical protein